MTMEHMNIGEGPSTATCSILYSPRVFTELRASQEIRVLHALGPELGVALSGLAGLTFSHSRSCKDSIPELFIWLMSTSRPGHDFDRAFGLMLQDPRSTRLVLELCEGVPSVQQLCVDMVRDCAETMNLPRRPALRSPCIPGSI